MRPVMLEMKPNKLPSRSFQTVQGQAIKKKRIQMQYSQEMEQTCPFLLYPTKPPNDHVGRPPFFRHWSPFASCSPWPIVWCWCVGVRLPRCVTGSCSATEAMVTKVMSQAQLKALDKCAANVVAGLPQQDHGGVRMKMNVKHCIFIL